MRRLITIPALLFLASVVTAFGGTRLGFAADRLGNALSHWASDAA